MRYWPLEKKQSLLFFFQRMANVVKFGYIVTPLPSTPVVTATLPWHHDVTAICNHNLD